MENEKYLEDNALIVSTTDPKGIITYINKEFIEVSEYEKGELCGRNHNLIRHPDMPKTIFKYLWENLHNKKTVLAYIKNYTKDKEKYYWVKSVLVPIIKNDQIVQFNSYRTKASEFSIEQISQVYALIQEQERLGGIEKGYEYFQKFLEERNLSYDEFIYRLDNDKQVVNKGLLGIDVTQFKMDHVLFRSAIESQVAQNEQNIEVTKPTCCAFGKHLTALEHESFAKDERFSQIKKLHNGVHDKMQQYVDAERANQEYIIQNVHQDIDSLFNVMSDLIDNYK